MRLPTMPNHKISENVRLEKIRSQTNITVLIMGTEVAQWIRFCATNRKVTGSIPHVIGIFH